MGWVVLGLIIGLVTVAARFSMSSSTRQPTKATRSSMTHSARVQASLRQMADNPLPPSDKDPEE